MENYTVEITQQSFNVNVDQSDINVNISEDNFNVDITEQLFEINITEQSFEVEVQNVVLSGSNDPHINVENPLGYVYILGDEETDGSIRISLTDEQISQFEKRIDGAWVRAELELSPSTLYLGKNLSISTAGSHLVTERTDGEHKEIYAHAEFTEEEGSKQLKILNMSQLNTRYVIQPDDSGELSGNIIDAYTVTGPFAIMTPGMYIRVGSIPASEPVELNVYNGPSVNSDIIFNERFPASQFQVLSLYANSVSTDFSGDAIFNIDSGYEKEIYVGKPVTLIGFTNYSDGDYIISDAMDNISFKLSGVVYNGDDSGVCESNERFIDARGFMELPALTTILSRHSSDSDFSIKANANNSLIWFASDFYNTYFDEILTTKEWVPFDTREQGAWFISDNDKKIFVCNESGVKGLTFTDEKKYWNELNPFTFTWEKLPEDQNLLIPENHQMNVHDTFTLEGDLNLEGSLVLRD